MTDLYAPWSVEQSPVATNIIGAHGDEIAQVFDPSHAALIAAAPELMEALRGALVCLESAPAPKLSEHEAHARTCRIKAIYAALAKAAE